METTSKRYVDVTNAAKAVAKSRIGSKKKIVIKHSATAAIAVKQIDNELRFPIQNTSFLYYSVFLYYITNGGNLNEYETD